LDSTIRAVIFLFLVLSRYGEETRMGTLHKMDRRREPRRQANFAVTIWGVDTKGERFLQEVRVRDISLSGALLCGIEADLRSGDLIGLLYRSRKARYRVVWVRYDDGGEKVQAAIHLVQPDICPWREMLGEEKEKSESVPSPVDWASLPKD
jgi:hypothetical protein